MRTCLVDSKSFFRVGQYREAASAQKQSHITAISIKSRFILNFYQLLEYLIIKQKQNLRDAELLL